MQEAVIVFIVFASLIAPLIVISLVYYFKKRLEHKQIMAAIEKGTPISEIMPPKPKPAGPAWIKYLSVGIALLIISLGFLIGGEFNIIAAFVLFGVGVAWLIRGLLYRKYQPQIQPSNKDSAVENENKNC